jgi:asparagine synthase (glutamine-hydrolysing)
VERTLVERMSGTVAHRGPDGEGVWVAEDGAVGLGHRRLAIIDLSDAAAQPMGNEDGRLRVVFNGEIYNHAELRAELERTGRHRWRTAGSDTEVILHAFEEWGIDSLHRFRGMFAFALWDGRAGELWLARDRVGVKPLYYARRPDRLLFASEIKAILADPAQPRAVDEHALFDYLSFLAVPAPRTLFDGIAKLEGGTWARVGRDGEVRVQRWWDVWDGVTPNTRASDAELATQVRDELRESVRLRTLSDRPVGLLLSGGLDSTTNLALFAEGRAEPINTFSIGYTGESGSAPDELEHARRAAAAFGATAFERRLEARDLIDFLPRMVRHLDEPNADPVCVPVYFLAEMARREGVVVCQVGEGADELFWGYPRWRTMLERERIRRRMPAAAVGAGRAALAMAGRGGGHAAEAFRRAAAGVPLFWGGAEGFPEGRKRRLLHPALRRRMAGHSSWATLAPIRARFEEAAWEPSDLHWMSYLDLRLRLPELLLMRVDRMTMAAGVEGRVPFLDHRVVELAMGIPTAAKTRGGVLKTILKEAVRGVVPDEVIDRPKQGFGVPLTEWFRGALGDFARSELDAFCRDADILDRREVEATLRRGDAWGAWYLLVLALWHREHFR